MNNRDKLAASDKIVEPPKKGKLLLGSAIGLVGMAAILIAFVLPAEFGIDPTGLGKATGLIKISEPPQTNAELERGKKRKGILTLASSPLPAQPGAKDQWEVELQPYESIEFKYQIPQGAMIVFAWEATAPLQYDMHAHPFVGGEKLTESYGIGASKGFAGRYISPFNGIHGWYWQNRGMEPVKLRLDASGAMTGSKIFDSTGEQQRTLQGGSR